MKQKSENQKAFPRFLGILVVASLIGGVLGGLSGVAGYFWEDHTAFGAAFAHSAPTEDGGPHQEDESGKAGQRI